MGDVGRGKQFMEGLERKREEEPLYPRGRAGVGQPPCRFRAGRPSVLRAVSAAGPLGSVSLSLARTEEVGRPGAFCGVPA